MCEWEIPIFLSEKNNYMWVSTKTLCEWEIKYVWVKIQRCVSEMTKIYSVLPQTTRGEVGLRKIPQHTSLQNSQSDQVLTL